MKKRTTEEFIELARQVHGDKYDYRKTIYNHIYLHINMITVKLSM